MVRIHCVDAAALLHVVNAQGAETTEDMIPA